MTEYTTINSIHEHKSRRARKKGKRIRRICIVIAAVAAAGILWLLIANANKASENTDVLPETEQSDLQQGTQQSVPQQEAASEAEDRKDTAAAELPEENPGLSGAAQIHAALLEAYPWRIRVRCKGAEPEEFPLSNLVEHNLAELAEQIADGEAVSYQLQWSADEDLLNRDFTVMNYLWSTPAVNSSITGYSTETGVFSFSEPQTGLAVNAEKLRTDILAAVAGGEFDKVIDAELAVVQPEIGPDEARALYKTIGTYITHSTSNPDRNNNLRLACEAIDGAFLAPGESFSFNHTTGLRSEDKGYKPAGAYQNGVTVQEPGGGVCQVASTLYNAVIRAGLKVTERHPHTYEPSYVTPGEDATVSFDGFGGPNLVFVNNTKAGIVIRASYADQTVACSIIGIPILAEGEEISLHSTKVETREIQTEYRDDPLLPAGEKVTQSEGSAGSRWDTYIRHTKNGTQISDELLHTSQYSGHNAVIRIGTGAAVEALNPELEVPADTPTFINGINGGPGVSGINGGPGVPAPAGQVSPTAPADTEQEGTAGDDGQSDSQPEQAQNNPPVDGQ